MRWIAEFLDSIFWELADPEELFCGELQRKYLDCRNRGEILLSELLSSRTREQIEGFDRFYGTVNEMAYCVEKQCFFYGVAFGQRLRRGEPDDNR